MSSDRPVRTNCYVKGHLGGSNCPQCRAEQQLQPPEPTLREQEQFRVEAEHRGAVVVYAKPEQPSPASEWKARVEMWQDTAENYKTLLEQAQQRIAELEKQLKAATSCFGRYGKIEFDVLESRAEQAEAERDALKARLQQVEGALRKYGRHQIYCEVRYDPSKCVCGFKEVLTPPAAGEEG